MINETTLRDAASTSENLRQLCDGILRAIEPGEPARQYKMGMLLRFKQDPGVTIRLTGADGQGAWWVYVVTGSNTGASWSLSPETLDAEWEPVPAEQPAPDRTGTWWVDSETGDVYGPIIETGGGKHYGADPRRNAPPGLVCLLDEEDVADGIALPISPRPDLDPAAGYRLTGEVRLVKKGDIFVSMAGEIEVACHDLIDDRAGLDGRRWIAEKIPAERLATKPGKRRTIVCLCGSGRFKDAFEQAEFDETLAGKIVLTIGCNTKDIARDVDWNLVKPMLDELHLRKIDLADEVLILNVGGYIGESTARELEYAKTAHKAIRYLEQPQAAPAEQPALRAGPPVIVKVDTTKAGRPVFAEQPAETVTIPKAEYDAWVAAADLLREHQRAGMTFKAKHRDAILARLKEAGR